NSAEGAVEVELQGNAGEGQAATKSGVVGGKFIVADVYDWIQCAECEPLSICRVSLEALAVLYEPVAGGGGTFVSVPPETPAWLTPTPVEERAWTLLLRPQHTSSGNSPKTIPILTYLQFLQRWSLAERRLRIVFSGGSAAVGRGQSSAQSQEEVPKSAGAIVARARSERSATDVDAGSIEEGQDDYNNLDRAENLDAMAARLAYDSLVAVVSRTSTTKQEQKNPETKGLLTRTKIQAIVEHGNMRYKVCEDDASS
ncbi:unnamed protein product, partial [Amoebophrya sp. A25]